MEKQKQSQRLLSLDALRGFDMFFIMGGASLFVALATLFPNPFFQAIGDQMHHVKWDGLKISALSESITMPFGVPRL